MRRYFRFWGEQYVAFLVCRVKHSASHDAKLRRTDVAKGFAGSNGRCAGLHADRFLLRGLKGEQASSRGSHAIARENQIETVLCFEKLGKRFETGRKTRMLFVVKKRIRGLPTRLEGSMMRFFIYSGLRLVHLPRHRYSRRGVMSSRTAEASTLMPLIVVAPA